MSYRLGIILTGTLPIHLHAGGQRIRTGANVRCAAAAAATAAQRHREQAARAGSADPPATAQQSKADITENSTISHPCRLS